MNKKFLLLLTGFSLLSVFVILPLFVDSNTPSLGAGWALGTLSSLIGFSFFCRSMVSKADDAVKTYFIRSGLKFCFLLVLIGICMFYQVFELLGFVSSIFIAYFIFLFYYGVALKD